MELVGWAARAQTIDETLGKLNAKIESFSPIRQADSLGIYLEGRMAYFYNNGLSDSVVAHAPHDLAILKSMQRWNEYYEVWTHLIDTYIYYSSQKNLALREVKKMFNDAKKRNHKYGMAMAYYTMGIVYQSMHNYDESEKAFLKGLEMVSQMSLLPLFTPELYSYYGDVLNVQRRYADLQQLTTRWKKSLRTIIRQHSVSEDQQEVLWFYYDIACAQAAIGLGNLRQAEQILLEVKEQLHEENIYDVISWLNTMVELRLKQSRFPEALELNGLRLDRMSANDDPSEYLNAISQRAEILTMLARYADANSLYREMYELKDSISHADTQEQLNELNTLFQVDELKMEKERAHYRYLLLIAGIVGLALTIFLVTRHMAVRRLRTAHENLQKTHDELQTTYELLEYSIKARELVEGDLRVARDIQLGMLPQDFPEREDIDLYAIMTPAKAVGGDFYCYLILDDLLYFCVGDVSGKGVPASLFMSQAIRLFRSNAKLKYSPASIATHMNNELTEANDQGMFVTMFMGVTNLSTGEMQYCNAGHNPPVLINENGTAFFMNVATNAPIGLWPDIDYDGETIDNVSGKTLFVYTDGLNEAENQQQEQFTEERMLAMVREKPFESSQRIIEMLRDAVEKHRDGAEPNDDLTMLCVRFTQEN